MKLGSLVAWVFVCVLTACQPAALPSVNIIEDDKITTLRTDLRDPSAILAQAGITLNENDRLLLNGLPHPIDQPITNPATGLGPRYPVTLQIRRAKDITLRTPEGEQTLHTSAFTVGAALAEVNTWLYANQLVHPDPQSPISNLPITIYQLPTRPITITSNNTTIQLATSVQTVGDALAGASIPLTGLDYSIPAAEDPLPPDGQVRVVHVSESLVLAQKPIPFASELQASADVPLDQTQILQPGENGLIVQRIRVRYEDGQEVSRLTEQETQVRPPRTRVLAYGTKVEVQTAVVDGVTIEYWRAVQMYATSYSPCRSGTEECHSGTSSGKSLRKGMVGLRYSWYLSMQGQRVYIPGYGFASVEDVCGGCVGRPWIDLGFSDNDFEPWHSWVTVYFLTPVPANVIYVLE